MLESAKIFSGTATKYLSEQIAAASGERLGEVSVARFSCLLYTSPSPRD